MTDSIVLLQAGQSPRLSRLLDFALAEVAVEPAGLPELEAMALQGRRVLIVLTTGEGGMSLEAFRLLQSLRTHPDCLRGATGALIVDGAGELYTKQAAQAVALAANLAGCLFPGKPLVRHRSLYNQHILAGQLGLPWEETYFTGPGSGRTAAGSRLPVPPGPRVLMLHAHNSRRSNTVAMGKAVCNHLAPVCDAPDHQPAKRSHLRLPGLLPAPAPPLPRNGTCYYGGPPAHGSLPRHFFFFTKRRGAPAVSQLQRLSQRQHPGPHQPNDRSAPARRPCMTNTCTPLWSPATPRETLVARQTWGPVLNRNHAAAPSASSRPPTTPAPPWPPPAWRSE